MRIRRILKTLLICIVCITGFVASSYCADNIPHGDVGEYGNWITADNIQQYNQSISEDAQHFQQNFQTHLHETNFVPIEVKIGLMFMKSLYFIDDVLKMSLIRFTILFLFIMYACWVGLEAYKIIRDSSDYKKALYDIFVKGITIAVWVVVLNYGPAKIFTMLISPIMALGVYLSDFILDAVAQTYNVNIPDTCATIQQYVANNASDKLLIDQQTAANIMCLPARLSVYFYHATASGFEWMINGFGNNPAMIAVGAICVVLFIKCILKYAFMTLGIVADLFLTLLMLPFTALAEAMPGTKETNYAGQIFSGFLKIFNTRKLSDVISTFINTAIYFASLSIIIAICATLLTNVISIDSNTTYSIGSAMTIILCGALILHLTGKTEKLTEELGGSIDNSFGEQLQRETKTLWKDATGFAGKLFAAWRKSK